MDAKADERDTLGLISIAMIVWLDRRVWAFVQKRRGPNVVGPFGLFQSFADVLKYVF